MDRLNVCVCAVMESWNQIEKNVYTREYHFAEKHLFDMNGNRKKNDELNMCPFVLFTVE